MELLQLKAVIYKRDRLHRQKSVLSCLAPNDLICWFFVKEAQELILEYMEIVHEESPITGYIQLVILIQTFHTSQHSIHLIILFSEKC